MDITISRKTLGSDHHLVYNGKDWTWSENFLNSSALWGFDHPRDLQSAAEALNLHIPLFDNTPWSRSQNLLVNTDSDIRWFDCMPRQVWKEKVKEAARQLWINFNNKDNSYYITTHTRNREITQGLSRAHIDTVLLNSRMASSNYNIKRSLLKFLPQDGLKCPPFKYSLSKSVTGRMTVYDGPNILTMKRSDRSIFKSRYSDGAIVEIDIVSAEPRVALSLFGKSAEGDIYKELIKKANLDITRADAKIATLSALYGASHHTIESKISNPAKAFEILDLVKDYFGVPHIEKIIKDQHQNLGYIKNTHGRKIFSDPPSLNHFIQSSTVDVAFDIFEDLLSKISEFKIDAVPIFIIHDAIVIDVKRSQIKELNKFCKSGLFSKTVDMNFPVKLKEIK